MKEQGSKKSYSEKLKDPRWLELRKEIIKDRGNKCQLCNGKDLKLHVHHLKYSGEPWEIDKSDLVVLCSYHHKMIHNKLKPIKLIPIKPLIYLCILNVDNSFKSLQLLKLA